MHSNKPEKVEHESSLFYYRVQIKSSNKALDISPANFKGMTNVFEYLDKDGLYKYTVGKSKTINELLFLQKSMRSKGFVGAFIIATLDGKRITLKQAKAYK